MRRFHVFGIVWAATIVAAVVSAACTGDDPEPASAKDAGGGLDGQAQDGQAAGDGSSSDDGGSSGEGGDDAGPPAATGSFVWELHADRAGDTLHSVTLGIGKNDVIGVASDYTQATTIGTTAVPGSGARSLSFVLDASKTVKWAAGQPAQDVSSVAVDSAGNVYIAGSFQTASVMLGSKTITNTNSNTDMPAGFYAKLSGTDGSVLWAVSISGTNGSTSYCNSVATRGTDVVVGCDFFGPIQYGTKDSGGGTVTTTQNTTSTNEGDSVVLVLDPADNTGRTIWSKHIHGTSNETLGAVAFDGSGNVLVAGGYTSSDLKVDTSPVASVTNAGTTGQDAYVMRFDGSGAHGVSLAKTWGAASPVNAVAYGLAYAPYNGDLVLCGQFSGTMNFGVGNLVSNAQDAFVMRTDSGGATQWVQYYGGSGNDLCSAVAVDAWGEIAVGGTHRSSNVTISGKSIPDPTGTSAAHVAKLDPMGKGLWAFAVNGTNASLGGLGFLAAGDVVYSGAFLGSTDLGNGTVQSANGGTQVSLFVVRRGP